MDIKNFLKLLLVLSILLTGIASIYGIVSLHKGKPGKFHITIIVLSLLILALFFIIRGNLKTYFPFTDKVESFTTLYFMFLLTVLIYQKNLSLKESIALMILGILTGFSVFLFTDTIRYPSPYLRTLWFPLHVPLSFASYALWVTAGVRSISILKTGSGDSLFVTYLNRMGFIFFSLSMIFGGIWGYFAWGAYFMWDPKLIWSVILWIFYGNMLHIDGLPSFKKFKHPLYVMGIIFILITFIGTGFFSRSIHRF